MITKLFIFLNITILCHSFTCSWVKIFLKPTLSSICNEVSPKESEKLILRPLSLDSGISSPKWCSDEKNCGNQQKPAFRSLFSKCWRLERWNSRKSGCSWFCIVLLINGPSAVKLSESKDGWNNLFQLVKNKIIEFYKNNRYFTTILVQSG